jgi:hypothetical protein
MLRSRLSFRREPIFWTSKRKRSSTRGFDGEIILPATYLSQLGDADGQGKWRLADGSIVDAPYFQGLLRFVGLTSTYSVTISLLGNQAMVGRSLTDHLTLILDHGERLTIEA